jgi:hypothetical protein
MIRGWDNKGQYYYEYAQQHVRPRNLPAQE